MEMDQQRSDVKSGHSRQQSQQESDVPAPLYSVHDALSPDIDVELEQEELPPRYSTAIEPRQLQGSSRARANQHQTVTHEFHIRSGGKASKPWATLRLLSHAASTEKVPRFYGHDNLAGSVDIELENGGSQNIQLVTLTLRGKLIPSTLVGNFAEPYTFLDKQHTIWSKSSSSGLSSGRRLEGNHSWPFSFPFPTQIEVTRGGLMPVHMYPTPQTFLERGKNISVQFELILKVSHGFLRPDTKLPINVTYIPQITPPPIPPVRQLAYREGTAVPGPEIDPEGWHTLPPTTVHGQLLQWHVEVTCVLSLAKPLTYTRGTFIPVHLVLGSNDSQALDIFSTPKAIQVRLMQTLEYFQDPKKVAGGQEEAELIAEAQWWAPHGPADQDAGRRILFGELHLPSGMQPTCSFLLLNVAYTVEFMPFVSPVFEPAQTPNIPVTSCPVKIGTFHAPGPLPKAVTPPPPRNKASETVREQDADLSGFWFRR